MHAFPRLRRSSFSMLQHASACFSMLQHASASPLKQSETELAGFGVHKTQFRLLFVCLFVCLIDLFVGLFSGFAFPFLFFGGGGDVCLRRLLRAKEYEKQTIHLCLSSMRPAQVEVRTRLPESSKLIGASLWKGTCSVIPVYSHPHD